MNIHMYMFEHAISQETKGTVTGNGVCRGKSSNRVTEIWEENEKSIHSVVGAKLLCTTKLQIESMY